MDISFPQAVEALLAGQLHSTCRSWKKPYLRQWQRAFDRGDVIHTAYDHLPDSSGQPIAEIRLTARPERQRATDIPDAAFDTDGFWPDKATFLERYGPKRELTVVQFELVRVIALEPIINTTATPLQQEFRMTDFLPLGFDLGNGAIKLHGPQGGLPVLAQVSANRQQTVGRLIGLASQKPPLHIVDEAGSFYVGAGAHDWGRPIENLGHDRFTGTPETRALFKAACTVYAQQYGPFTAPLHLMLGLPLEPLSGDEAPVTVENARRWLKGLHTWEADGQPYTIEIADVRVTSQPVGAFFDHLLDEEGRFMPARKHAFAQEVGIISIGFNTIELLVVRDKAPVQRFTASTTAGVRRLLELVNQQRLYSLGELDVLLRAGKLDVREALPVWEREVTGFIEQRWGTAWRRFAAVLLVGGGAVLLKDTLPARFHGKAIVPDDPVLAIARGLYKLNLSQLRQKKA